MVISSILHWLMNVGSRKLCVKTDYCRRFVISEIYEKQQMHFFGALCTITLFLCGALSLNVKNQFCLGLVR